MQMNMKPNHAVAMFSFSFFFFAFMIHTHQISAQKMFQKIIISNNCSLYPLS